MPSAKSNPHWVSLRKRIAKAPTGPGIYKWLDENGTTLYVGKAKNLRNRLKSYIPTASDVKDGLTKLEKALGPWKRSLIEAFAELEYTVTGNELEALVLETNLIKQLRPKYNVLMKDDKNYVYVEVTVKDAWPRVDVVRKMERRDAKYFGPFLSAYEVRRILDLLHDVLCYRACKTALDALNAGKPVPEHPCLDSQIGECCVCKGALTQGEYRPRMESVMEFFKGHRQPVISAAQERMRQAVAEKKFERAAKLRDALQYIANMEERQIVSDTSREDADVLGIARASNRSCVVALRVRDGRVIAEDHHFLAGSPATDAELLGEFLPQYVEAQAELPPLILIGEAPEDMDLLQQWVCAHTGRNVELRVPERGRKNKLLQLAEDNALEKLKAQETKWEVAARNVESALEELQRLLNLPAPPKRIECYDISHLGGTETVGSMVVGIDGKPRNDLYRNFTIKTLHEGDIDDYKALQEVLKRRLRHLTSSRKAEEQYWESKGIAFGKALKKEQKMIEEIHNAHPEEMSSVDINYTQYTVARLGEEIVAFGRLVSHPGKLLELKSIWVADAWRSQKLGQTIARLILKGIKRGKAYVTIVPSLEGYYASLGFRYVNNPPKVLLEEMALEKNKFPETPDGIAMVYDTVQNKDDVSLTAQPDLLVIDGGKGQLSAVLEIEKSLGISIPTVGLAKREEEIFASSSGEPIEFPKESQGRFLLMRLRDEAHRFANAHRQKRLEKRVFA